MVKLVLLRNGESQLNEKNLFTGWVDVELSKKGIGEAIKPDILFTSKLSRTM